MRNLVFEIFVILMIPIYLIICLLKLVKHIMKKIIELSFELTDPIAEGMITITDNMVAFWKKQIKKLERMNRYGNKN